MIANIPAPPKIDALLNEKLAAVPDGSVVVAGLPKTFWPVLKLNEPNGFAAVEVSGVATALPAFALVNELNENDEFVIEDDGVVVPFDRLLLGT